MITGQPENRGRRSILDHLAAQNDALIEIHRLLDEIRKQKGCGTDTMWNGDTSLKRFPLLL